MFDRLEIFALASARAQHAAARQAVVAQNIANADTPGYRARDISSFDETWREMQMGGGPRDGLPVRTIDANGTASPNGNSVSLELEMLRGIEAQRAHSRALQVYGSAMSILRTSIGR
ncbi:FlgB family protein [Roseicyclus mahoneyensis]|uniref:Flagellar basal-body rod protein FlgB n=1 Tax=Roseicyclus mahoneyensis TaxID=164332 RepID=A0A316GFZ1_9RHOB|nr:FlgB family protein [Roseicyclus mahoneyensis]PWK59794.1 flagellar basal-body rod protein FlgB [Roseicyclus mahoneyensis]